MPSALKGCFWKVPNRETLLCSSVRYLVKAKLKAGKARALLRAVNGRSLGRGSIAGDEYLHDMRMARMNEKGETHWVETCFCDPPLDEERPYWEEFFDLLAIKDAHARPNCRHENGTELWACGDCDCTRRLEEKVGKTGQSFLAELRIATGAE
jgi:hypothetical protein